MEAFSHDVIQHPMESAEKDIEDDGLFANLAEQIAQLMIDDDDEFEIAHNGKSAQNNSSFNLQNQMNALDNTAKIFEECWQRHQHESNPSVRRDFRSLESFKWEIAREADHAIRVPFSAACISRVVHPAIHNNVPLKPSNSFTIRPVLLNSSDRPRVPPTICPVPEVYNPSNFRGKFAKRGGSGTGVFIPRSCKLSYIKAARQAEGLQYAHSSASLLRRRQRCYSSTKRANTDFYTEF